MRKIKVLLSVILLFVNFLLFSCTPIPQNIEPISEEGTVLGTLCSVKIYDKRDTSILDLCFSKLVELENTLSINKTGTLIDEVNANSGIKPVKVSKEIIDLVEYTFKYSDLSGGLFDISIGTLVKKWHIGFDDERVPSPEEIEEAKSTINYKDIIINKDDSTIFLKDKGMMLDFGSIAKGYAADCLNTILTENGVKSAIIDLGGNLFMKGKKVDGSQWIVGIQDPDETRGDYIGTVKADNKSFVTSGIYEKYFIQDGVYYHHLLNPFTGYPENNDILSVSVISDISLEGECLTKTLYFLGKDKGLEYVESRKDIQAIYILKNYNVYISSGLKNNFILTNSKYTLKN
ncbi:MAG: FAD:protein FMN transferase [Oscillospiraceae bacterium]|nr:FAD:protein FMN transferase [Oscillospiraceae bacterium]